MMRRNKPVDNTGFGNNTVSESNRLSNKDGSYNVIKRGIPLFQRYSVLHSLLRMKTRRFLLLVLLYYFLVNTLFALVYYFVGVEHLNGAIHGTGPLHNFLQAFFFSAQTITTVGYGHIHPDSVLTNMIAALESFTGILTFAVITGLIYARFAQPRAFIRFSEVALISPFKEGKALMFRLATYKNNNLTNVTAQVICSMHIMENDKPVARFFNLPLEISRINTLVSSWTVVHPIDEESPLWDITHDEMKKSKTEILVQVEGMDDHLFTMVQQKTSYVASEIIFDARFEPIIHRSMDGEATYVDLGEISTYQKVQS